MQHTFAIRDLNDNGQGVGQEPGGRVTFIDGALPGEVVRATVTVEKKAYAVAALDEVQTPSPERVEPFCPVFGQCGGCQLQHLSLSAQRAWKVSHLQQTLKRIGGLDVGAIETLATDHQGYRATLRLVCRHEDGVFRMGFYEQRSHDLVALEDCPVSTDNVRAVLRWLHEEGNRDHSPLHQAGTLGLREGGTGQVQVLLGLEARTLPEKWHGGPVPGGVSGIHASLRPRGNRLFGDQWVTLHGGATLPDDRLGFSPLRLSPGSFMQAHPAVHDQFLQHLETHAKAQPPTAVADLYAGAGLSSLILKRAGHTVTSVENSTSAHEDTAWHVTVHAPGTRPVCMPVTAWLRRQKPGAFPGVFLDPPRQGLENDGAKHLAQLRPRWIVYQSCRPATLARDAAVLTAAGYRVTHTLFMDFFPHTAHIEAALFLEAP